MQNLSSLLVANHSLIDLLVKALYDDFMIVKDDLGEDRLIFIRHYQGRKVYFNEQGMLLLYQAAIAFFLKTSKQGISRSIKALEKSGFFAENPETVIKLMTPIQGQPPERPITFYNGHTISVIANRFTKPSQEAMDFIKFREQMMMGYQEILIKVAAEVYQQGFADGQAAAHALPHLNLDSTLMVAPDQIPEALVALTQQWPQVVHQVDLLTERIWELYDRMGIAEMNHHTLAGKHEELERTYLRDMPKRMRRR